MNPKPDLVGKRKKGKNAKILKFLEKTNEPTLDSSL